MLFRLLLPLFLLLGAVLRWLPLMQRDFWYDEAFTGIAVRQSWSGMMAMIAADVHPPVYYVLLKLWATLFGSTELALRAFSLVCGVALIGAVFWLLRLMAPKRPWAAVIAAGVVAINPFFVNYSQEARMYALLALLLTLAVAAFYRAQRGESFFWRLVYGVFLALAALTHYVGAVFAVVAVVVDGAQNWRSWRTAWVTYVIPGVAGLWWLPTFLAQRAENASLGWVPQRSFFDVLLSLHIFFFGAPVGVPGVPPPLGYRIPLLSVGVVSIGLLVLLSCLVTRAVVKKQWTSLHTSVTSLALGPFALLFVAQFLGQRLYVERYLVGTAVFLVVLIALLLERLPRRWLQATVLTYILLVSLIAPWKQVHEWPQVRSLVQGRVGPVVVTDAFNYVSVRMLLGEEAPVSLYNLTDPQMDFSAWDAVDPRDVLRELPTEPYTIITTQPTAFPQAVLLGTARDVSVFSLSPL